MSRIHAASALLLLSLPNGFASLLAQEALPVFQLLNAASSRAAAAIPTGDVLANVSPAAVSSVPEPTDVSDLTGGVLTSPDVAAQGSPLPLSDPTFIGGPENELTNPIPDPLIPSPNPVDSALIDPLATPVDASALLVAPVPTFTDSAGAPIAAIPTAIDSASIFFSPLPSATDAVPSPIEVVSAILNLAGTPIARPSNSSLAANFSVPEVSVSPVPILDPTSSG